MATAVDTTPMAMTGERMRNFQAHNTNVWHKKVYDTYVQMHTHQTVDFVRAKIEKYGKFDKAEMTIMEAMEKLHDFVDETDPDVNVPNVVHAYQTAEKIRRDFPDNEWFIFTGFIHDLGKVLCMYDEPQWCIGGDTFIVGCQPAGSVVYRNDSFNDYPDLKNPKYNTKYGIYSEHCGLDNVLMSWGHDEYLYRVLKNHPENRIPEEGMYMIRFHSFYPWHSFGDYKHLSNEHDESMLKWIHLINKYDQYSKIEAIPDMAGLRSYYAGLAEKFCPGKIKW